MRCVRCRSIWMVVVRGVSRFMRAPQLPTRHIVNTIYRPRPASLNGANLCASRLCFSQLNDQRLIRRPYIGYIIMGRTISFIARLETAHGSWHPRIVVYTVYFAAHFYDTFFMITFFFCYTFWLWMAFGDRLFDWFLWRADESEMSDLSVWHCQWDNAIGCCYVPST